MSIAEMQALDEIVIFNSEDRSLRALARLAF